MPEACEPADMFWSSLLFTFQVKRSDDQRSPLFFLLNFCIFGGRYSSNGDARELVACSRLSVSADERGKRANERASGRKTVKREKGKDCGHLNSHHSYPAHFQKNRFSCQNAPRRRKRETSYSVPSHSHVIIRVRVLGRFFCSSGGRAGMVDIGGGERPWYLPSRGWHITT